MAKMTLKQEQEFAKSIGAVPVSNSNQSDSDFANSIGATPIYGNIHNALAGLVNPAVNMVNLGVMGANKLLPTQYNIPQVPTMPANKDTLSYMGGNLAGFIIPTALTEGLAGLGEGAAAAAAPTVASALSRAPMAAKTAYGLGRAATTGAAAGALGSDQGNRGTGAAFGGAGGVGGQLAGHVISGLLSEATKKPIVQKLAASIGSPVEATETAPQNMFLDIMNNYNKHLSKANDLYKQAFDALGGKKMLLTPNMSASEPVSSDISNTATNQLSNIPSKNKVSIQPGDFKNYQAAIEKGLKTNSLPKSAIPLNNLNNIELRTNVVDPNGDDFFANEYSPAFDVNGKNAVNRSQTYNINNQGIPEKASMETLNQTYGKIDPRDIHFYKSLLGSEVEGLKNSNKLIDANKLAPYQSALDKDLKSFMDKNGALDQYNTANQFYKNNIVPFKQQPGMNNLIKNSKGTITNHPITGEKQRTITNIDYPSQTASSLASRYIPAANDKSMDKINTLEKLLTEPTTNDSELSKEASKNAQNLAKIHTRSNLFGKYFVDDANPNWSGFFNRYKQLSPTQKDHLFTPKASEALDILSKNKNKLKEDSVVGTTVKRLLGAVIGGHSGLPSPMGEIAGAALEPTIERGVNAALYGMSPKTTPALVNALKRGGLPRAPKTLARLGTISGSTLANTNNAPTLGGY